MADNKKEQERANLHNTLWKMANDVRGSVDGWDFKNYVFGMLFYRFISENFHEYVNQRELPNDPNFDYGLLQDDIAEYGKDELIKEKGFFILPSHLFSNVSKKAEQDDNFNTTLANIFQTINHSAQGYESEDAFGGLFQDFDVNSPKLGSTVKDKNKLLVKLMKAVKDLDLGNYADHTIDVFGDAYEYLIQMYAANAGKSGGEFFTPQEVSQLLTRITLVGRKKVNKVYDPACGSGSLLLNFAKILGEKNVEQGFFGQELNLTTYNLCRMNMFLHNINYDKIHIFHGDTLTQPHQSHMDAKPFEAIVSNPPYSTKWEGSDNPLLIQDPRFTPAGILAPKSYADMAFIMHSLSWLATNGTAAIVCFPGIFYRGGAEKKIRQYLVKNNYIDCIIQMPPDLFFGTGIATSILVMKKNKKDTKILFIDASAEFIRGNAKNKLSTQNIESILETFAKREEREYFSRLVDLEEIEAQDYNLSVSRYVQPKDNTPVIEIAKLNAEIEIIVKKQNELRREIDAIVRDLEGQHV